MVNNFILRVGSEVSQWKCIRRFGLETGDDSSGSIAHQALSGNRETRTEFWAIGRQLKIVKENIFEWHYSLERLLFHRRFVRCTRVQIPTNSVLRSQHCPPSFPLERHSHWTSLRLNEIHLLTRVNFGFELSIRTYPIIYSFFFISDRKWIPWCKDKAAVKAHLILYKLYSQSQGVNYGLDPYKNWWINYGP